MLISMLPVISDAIQALRTTNVERQEQTGNLHCGCFCREVAAGTRLSCEFFLLRQPQFDTDGAWCYWSSMDDSKLSILVQLL